MKEIIDGIEYVRDGDYLIYNGLTFKKISDDNNELCLFDVDASSFSDDEDITIILPKACKTIDSEASQTLRNKVVRIVGIGIEHLGEDALSKMQKLREMYFPNLKSVGDYACNSCPQLQYVPNLSNCKFVGKGAFSNCPNLNGHINEKNEKIDDVICIPNNITRLEETFSNSGVKNVIFESGKYTLINTFQCCINLEYVNIFYDETIEATLESGVFYNTGLREVRIHKNMLFFGQGCFAGCKSLKKVEANRTIWTTSFENCENLTEVILREGCKEIGSYAFRNTGVESIDLSNVDDVQIGAFSQSKLKKFKGNPRIHNAAMRNTLLESVTVGNVAGTRSFADCQNLTDVKIETSYDNIKDYSLPVSCLINDESIDIHKIDMSTLQKGAIEKLKKILNYWNGGYYKGTKDNPYDCLIMHEANLNLPAYMADKKNIYIHPKCTTMISAAFEMNNHSNIESSSVPDMYKYDLYMPGAIKCMFSNVKKYGELLGKLRERILNFNVISDGPVMELPVIDGENINEPLLIKNFDVIKVSPNVKTIINADTLQCQKYIVMPPEMDKLTFAKLPKNFSMVIPRKINEISLPVGLVSSGKVELNIEKGTLRSTVDKFQNAFKMKDMFGKEIRVSMNGVANIVDDIDIKPNLSSVEI